MSGTTQEWSYDSPGGRRESEAAVREGIARAVAAVAVTQVEAEQFMTANGAGAVAPRRVGKAGRQGDPDVYGADEADAND
jgi:hypothetical protein